MRGWNYYAHCCVYVSSTMNPLLGVRTILVSACWLALLACAKGNALAAGGATVERYCTEILILAELL